MKSYLVNISQRKKVNKEKTTTIWRESSSSWVWISSLSVRNYLHFPLSACGNLFIFSLFLSLISFYSNNYMSLNVLAENNSTEPWAETHSRKIPLETIPELAADTHDLIRKMTLPSLSYINYFQSQIVFLIVCPMKISMISFFLSSC